MPAEIKLKCIGKLELKERLSLRCTAKAERSLVDSQKIEFTRGRFWGHDEDLGFFLFRENRHLFEKKSKDSNIIFDLMNYIKKVGVFENLEISSRNSLTDYEQFLNGDELFTAKNIEFAYCHIDNMIAVLQKTKDGFESIKIEFGEGLSNDFADICAISQIQSVPYWHIDYYEGTDSLHKVAQLWIDKNTEIGFIFQAAVCNDGSFEEFLENFTDCIVSQSDTRVRIRTNNPDRHILLQRGLDGFIELIDFRHFFRLIVISAEMKESEYDENCEKWLREMVPYHYEDTSDTESSFESDDDFEWSDGEEA